MKHQNFSKSTKAKFPAPNRDNDEHRITVRNHRLAPETVHKKPLAGRIFYLDLPCNKRTQALESDIKNLGGTVEKFFSKEIRYLVSSKPEARHVQRLVQDSPVPSPDSGLSSPHPGSRRDSHSHRGSSQGPADTVVVSRGKSLVEKVVKEQERVQINRILANALEWGVKILYINDVISYINKKKSALAQVRAETHPVKKNVRIESMDITACQTGKPGCIIPPFIKVEDYSRHYRPLYLPMANLPVCNLRSAAPCSPFLEANVEENPGKRTKGCGSGGDCREKSRKDKQRGRECKGRRKGGYCECCLVKYDNISEHLQSEQHQAFSKSEEYLVVDRIISGLTCEFLQINPELKRVKCSVTSPLIIPGAVITDRKMRVKEKDVTDDTPIWCSPDNEQSVCKRSRELSQSPKEDFAGHPDTFQKFQSKCESFEWESSSNAALQKVLGTSLCNTRQDNYSECLEATRSCFHTYSEGRTLQSTRRFRLSDPAVCRTSRSSLDAGTSHKVSKLCDQLITPGPFCTSGQVTNYKLRNDDMSSSSMDSSSGVLQRKVRTKRRRRTAPFDPLFKPVEFQTLLCPGNGLESNNLSVSALDLWQLFQSSNDMEEDFKGF